MLLTLRVSEPERSNVIVSYPGFVQSVEDDAGKCGSTLVRVDDRVSWFMLDSGRGLKEIDRADR